MILERQRCVAFQFLWSTPGAATATGELTTARNASSIADGHLGTAEDAWEKQMEKTYGALVVEIGRAAADKFFPKFKVKAKKGGSGVTPVDG